MDQECHFPPIAATVTTVSSTADDNKCLIANTAAEKYWNTSKEFVLIKRTKCFYVRKSPFCRDWSWRASCCCCCCCCSWADFLSDSLSQVSHGLLELGGAEWGHQGVGALLQLGPGKKLLHGIRSIGVDLLSCESKPTDKRECVYV